MTLGLIPIVLDKIVVHDNNHNFKVVWHVSSKLRTFAYFFFENFHKIGSHVQSICHISKPRNDSTPFWFEAIQILVLQDILKYFNSFWNFSTRNTFLKIRIPDKINAIFNLSIGFREPVSNGAQSIRIIIIASMSSLVLLKTWQVD